MTGYTNPLPGVAPGSGFGMRVHPISGVRKMHNGVDMGAPTGTPVYAVTAGTVKLKPWNGGAGNTVELHADNGDVFKYFHLSAFSVPPGATVKPGQEVGKVGSTGASTGPHLHFEWHPGGGAAVDPMPIITGSATPAPSAGGGAAPIQAAAGAGLPGVPNVSLLTDPATWVRVAAAVSGAALVIVGTLLVIRDTKLGQAATAIGVDAAKVAALGPAGAAL